MYKRSFGKPIFDPMFDLIQSDSIRHAENSNPFYGARSEALEVEILTMAGQINAAQYRFLTLLLEFDEHGGWHGHDDGSRENTSSPCDDPRCEPRE
ncbi:MAG: hypothetical protein ACJA0W_003577 [Candidatus Azotimanducaceae bacterium]|jgi:hypothetical protein